LIERARAEVRRSESADTVVYDFSAEIARQRRRVDDLLDGADVLVYRHEIHANMEPPRDGQHVFTLRGDRLVPAEYERVAPAQGAVDVATFWPHNALEPGHTE
jgi:hypothetical protein